MGDFPQFVRVWGCELNKREKEIVLKTDGDRAHILTAKEHKPSFALHVNAKMDSKNLRLYYNLGVMFFNWEGNEDELRIHDPATEEVIGVANKGKIEPDKYHDIVWEIYPNGMRVLVDGNERARRRGDYEKLEASPGIGPAFGSVFERDGRVHTVNFFLMGHLQRRTRPIIDRYVDTEWHLFMPGVHQRLGADELFDLLSRHPLRDGGFHFAAQICILVVVSADSLAPLRIRRCEEETERLRIVEAYDAPFRHLALHLSRGPRC